MKILRAIIGAIVLISGAFFAVMSLMGTANTSMRGMVIGIIFVGGALWFLMQMADPQRPKEAAQKPKKEHHQKPSAKEDELIKYIRANILVSNTCSTRRYNNRNIDFDRLVEDLSHFYEEHFKWSKPTRIQFENIVSIINNESIVVLIKGVNNIVVKVHVPVDAREAKPELVGAASPALGNIARDELIAVRRFGRMNSGAAPRPALGEKDTTVEVLMQKGRSLEESIVKYIDDHVRNNQSSQKCESLDMINLRSLKNWRA